MHENVALTNDPVPGNIIVIAPCTGTNTRCGFPNVLNKAFDRQTNQRIRVKASFVNPARQRLKAFRRIAHVPEMRGIPLVKRHRGQ